MRRHQHRVKGELCLQAIRNDDGTTAAPPSGKVQILCSFIDGIDEYLATHEQKRSNSSLEARRMLALRDLRVHYPTFMDGDYVALCVRQGMENRERQNSGQLEICPVLGLRGLTLAGRRMRSIIKWILGAVCENQGILHRCGETRGALCQGEGKVRGESGAASGQDQVDLSVRLEDSQLSTEYSYANELRDMAASGFSGQISMLRWLPLSLNQNLLLQNRGSGGTRMDARVGSGPA